MATASGPSKRPPPRPGDLHVALVLPSLRGCDEGYLMVAGDVDILTAPELDRLLRDHLRAVPAGGCLLVDLSGIGHFSAAGVTVLCRAAAAARDRRVTLHLGPVSRQVGRVLDICTVDLTATDRST